MDNVNNAKKNVSVVMCTYNGEEFIQEQIQSIISQTYPIYELLIFDDASTDDTVQKIMEIALKNSTIKIIVNEKNIGYTKNFEQAIKAATGDVIAISDQDDIWINTKVEKMIKAWQLGHPLIYCNSFIFSDTLPTNPPSPIYRQFEGTDARKIFFFNTVSGHATLIKKEFAHLVLPFTEGVMYDWWMAVVAAYNGGVQHYNETLVYHRSHSKNVTINSMNKYSEAEQRFHYKIMLVRQTQKFATAPNIPPVHKDFLIKYHTLLNESLTKTFHIPLFLFTLKNRLLLFNYKRRKVGIFSYIKHSYLRTYNPIKLNEKESI